MNTADNPVLAELGDILGALVDQTITTDQQLRLAELLRGSHEARLYYHDYLDTHEDIVHHLGGAESDLGSVLSQIAAESRPAARPPLQWPALTAVALAAMAMLAFSLQYRRALDTSLPPPQPMAILTDAVDATWQQPIAVGDQFSRNAVTLTAGAIAISFGEGARTIVRGPARFRITGTNSMHLEQGILYATVPSSAVGFRVNTPGCSVVDLGTEFGLQVEKNGTVEMHVTRGAVRALTLDETAAEQVVAGEARMVRANSPNELRSIEFAGERFPRSLPTATRLGIPEGIRWELTPNADGKVYARQSDESVAYRGILMPNAEDGPQWQLTEAGSALYFDGVDDYLQTDFLGVGEDKSRSVTFWAKVPVDGTHYNSVVPMVSWGSFDRDGGVWQISWNNSPNDGQIGGLRIGAWKGQVVGTTDIRDNRWHHLAVVMNGHDMSTGISLYVDGKLEKVTMKNVEIRTLLMDNMRIGHSIDDKNHFKGWLADVHVFEGALTSDQIEGAAQARHALEK